MTRRSRKGWFSAVALSWLMLAAPIEGCANEIEGSPRNEMTGMFWARTGRSGYRDVESRMGDLRIKKRVRFQNIDAEVFFAGTPEHEYEVEAIFFVKNERTNEFSIFDYYSQRLREQSAKFTFEIKPVVGTQSFSTYHEQLITTPSGVFLVPVSHYMEVSGSKTYGWVVRLKNPGHAPKIESNQGTLRELAERRGEQLDQQVAAFLKGRPPRD